MARITRQTRREREATATDTISLLESASEKPSLRRRTKHKPVSGKERSRPLGDQKKAIFPLRLQNYVGLEAWWASLKTLGSQEVGSECNEGRESPTGDSRLDWMRRLRPKPHRQSALAG